MMDSIHKALIYTGIQVLVLICPGLALIMAMSRVSDLFTRLVCRVIGIRGYLLIFGWLGTTVHELSHALMALIFRHKIEKIKFFQLNSDSDVLGYVRHLYDPKSMYQRVGNLFIGVAPVLVGAVVIFLSAVYLAPGMVSAISEKRFSTGAGGWFYVYLSSFFSILRDLVDVENYFYLKYYLFLYILFCVGSSMTLSKADLKGAKSGFAVLVAVLLGVNLFREIFYSFFFPYGLINFLFFAYNLMAGVLLLQLLMIGLFRVFSKKRKAS